MHTTSGRPLKSVPSRALMERSADSRLSNSTKQKPRGSRVVKSLGMYLEHGARGESYPVHAHAPAPTHTSLMEPNSWKRWRTSWSVASKGRFFTCTEMRSVDAARDMERRWWRLRGEACGFGRLEDRLFNAVLPFFARTSWIVLALTTTRSRSLCGVRKRLHG